VIRSFATKSLENYTIFFAISGVLIAGLLTFIPVAAFGTFWQMATILVTADLVVYIAMKLKLIRLPRVFRKR
jgi:hypothetical protein